MLIPFKAKNPPESFPYATCALIGVNLLVYVFTSEYGLVIREEVAVNYGLSGNHPGPLNWLTSMFIHGNIVHILGNMWFLYLFGFAVEGRLRAAKFLLLYFLAGLAGSAAHFLMFAAAKPEIPALGASGAIMGLLGAALYMFPFGQMAFFYWFWFFRGVFVWPMWGVALYYLGFDVVGALVDPEGGVAHLAHIGGAAGGFVVAFMLGSKRDSAEASEAKATYSEANDLSVLSPRELAAIHASNPDDAFVALHWMHRSIRDPYGVKPECLEAFRRLLPKMIRELEVPPIGFCVASVAWTPGVVPPGIVLDLGHKLERAGEFPLAVRHFEIVVKDPNARPAELESAMFRIGILCETALGNHQRALASYYELIRRFELSPLAEQAKARARSMEARGLRL